MKAYIITSGKFSPAGNYSGYSADGLRIHIHKGQMDAMLEKSKVVPLTFYCIADEKLIPVLDSQGKQTGKVVSRLTAISIYHTYNEIVESIDAANRLEESVKIMVHNPKIDLTDLMNETELNSFETTLGLAE